MLIKQFNLRPKYCDMHKRIFLFDNKQSSVVFELKINFLKKTNEHHFINIQTFLNTINVYVPR